MQTVIDFFKGDPWLNMLFLLLAIISIVLAIVFYYRSLKNKRPVFSKQTFRLINENLSQRQNIEIKYKDVLVKNLSLTKIAIWNSGKESIRNIDIASSDPLVILSSQEAIIYDFEISYQKMVNNIKVTRVNEKSLSIGFEFLDLNDGIVLNIFHNGTNSNDIIIKGTLIGAKSISNGIKRDLFSRKADILAKSINYLIANKNIFFRILGWLVILPGGIILLPITIVALTLDTINYKIINRTPLEFNLYDQ